MRIPSDPFNPRNPRLLFSRTKIAGDGGEDRDFRTQITLNLRNFVPTCVAKGAQRIDRVAIDYLVQLS